MHLKALGFSGTHTPLAEMIQRAYGTQTNEQLDLFKKAMGEPRRSAPTAEPHATPGPGPTLQPDHTVARDAQRQTRSDDE